MLTRDPADIFHDYERFLRKKDYHRAYQRMESLLREFPDDDDWGERMVHLCLVSLQDPRKAKHWLKCLINRRDWWGDHFTLSQVQARLGDIPKAKESFRQARALLEHAPFSVTDKNEALKDCAALEQFIKYTERNSRLAARQVIKVDVQKKKSPALAVTDIPSINSKTPQALTAPHADKVVSGKPTEMPSPGSPIASPEFVPLEVKFLPMTETTLLPFYKMSLLSFKEARLRLDFEHLNMQGEFNELLCLGSIKGIDKYWYQIETVKKVLKYFHGRVLLCDEVGLGKTVEAGMLIKEYLMRHMAKTILILVPPALVSQWQEEMSVKFGLMFTTTEDPLFNRDPASFWKTPLLIASVHTAKHEKNLELIARQFYDIVVVDEAHHLRNRATQVWNLVNIIQKKFIFLLTATPVQNNLIELFNLITLLKPGQFKTEKMFKEEFLVRGDLRAVVDKGKLRQALKEIMVRNTRSAIDLKLPKRFAATMRLMPTEMEQKVYEQLNGYLKRNPMTKTAMNLLLKEAGSSPFALRETFLKMIPSGEINGTIENINTGEDIAKGRALIEIIGKNPKIKKIIFTQYLKSMDYITSLLSKNGISHTTFHGGMTVGQKDDAIQKFRDDVEVIVSSESGGEGRNLQFCNTIINFDLPWNPMRIEQRIGRLHRIGQDKDVFVFNLSVKGTIEDYIIDILDNKINMFEMVIGEIEPILGHIGQDQDFEDVIMDLWLNSKDSGDLGQKMEHLGNDLIRAKQEYVAARNLDHKIFGDDYQT